jgi:hypothetical protein
VFHAVQVCYVIEHFRSQIDGVTRRVGPFENVKEAAVVYDREVVEARGDRYLESWTHVWLPVVLTACHASGVQGRRELPRTLSVAVSAKWEGPHGGLDPGVGAQG